MIFIFGERDDDVRTFPGLWSNLLLVFTPSGEVLFVPSLSFLSVVLRRFLFYFLLFFFL